MGMTSIRYKVEVDTPYSRVAVAKCQLPVFGVWAELNLSCFTVTSAGRPTTALSFGLRGIPNSEVTRNSRLATIDGRLLIPRGSAGHRQYVEQRMTIPPFYGKVMRSSYLLNGGVAAARNILQNCFRQMEAVIEGIRIHIRNELSRYIWNEAIETLHARYDAIVREYVAGFLGDIFWQFLLDRSGLDTQGLNSLAYMTAHNTLSIQPIIAPGDSNLDLPNAGIFYSDDVRTLADLRATDLLRTVCGEKLGKEFEYYGWIKVSERGYIFVIEPGHFIRCTDPAGRHAQLCIHTWGCCCNPIDEVIIAYLHIRHRFADFMRTAILHYADENFRRVA